MSSLNLFKFLLLSLESYKVLVYNDNDSESDYSETDSDRDDPDKLFTREHRVIQVERDIYKESEILNKNKMAYEQYMRKSRTLHVLQILHCCVEVIKRRLTARSDKLPM